MTKDGLINCKKCGTLFFKNSGREVCDACYEKELQLIDSMKSYIFSSEKEKVSPEELANALEINKTEIEDLITRGRLFTILPKLSVKCRFCGIELEDDEKTGFTCKKCLKRFSPKVNEIDKKSSFKNFEEEAKNLNRRLRGGMNSATDNKNRYGFIQNYNL